MTHCSTRLFAAALAASLLFGPASSQITKQGGAYLLRMKFTPGQTIRYAMTTKMTGAGGASGAANTVTSAMTMKTVSVKNRVATVTAAIGPIMMNGRKLADVQNATIQMDSRGKAQGASAARMQGMNTTFPEKPVRVGEKWTSTMNTQGISATSTYTLKGFKQTPLGQAAVLSVAVSGGISGTGSTLVLMKDGTLYNSTANMSIKQGGQSMKMAVTLTRK